MKHEVVHRGALYEAIGDSLAEMRKLRNVSTAEAAAAAGIGAGTMQKYERGISPAPVHVLASLARFYGVTMNELVPIAAYRRRTTDRVACPKCGHVWGAYEDKCHCDGGTCHNAAACATQHKSVAADADRASKEK